jgi:hypothetical protein
MSKMTAKAVAKAALSSQRLGLLLLLALLFAVHGKVGWAQTSVPDRGSIIGTPRQTIDDSGDTNGGLYDSVMGQRRLKMLNNERHKSIVSDSDKLIKLTTELNDEIAHSNSGSLTPEQLHKIAEIEKLAHDIRDKMTMTIGAPTSNWFPQYGSPFGPQ